MRIAVLVLATRAVDDAELADQVGDQGAVQERPEVRLHPVARESLEHVLMQEPLDELDVAIRGLAADDAVECL